MRLSPVFACCWANDDVDASLLWRTTFHVGWPPRRLIVCTPPPLWQARPARWPLPILSRSNLARFCHRGVGLKNCAFLFPREYVQSRNLPDFGIPNSRTGNCPCRTACRPAIEYRSSENPLHAVAVLTFPNHQPGRGKSSTHPAEPFCSPLVCPAITRIRGEPPAIPRDRGEPPPSAALRPAIPPRPR